MREKFEKLRKALLAGGDAASPPELLKLYAEGIASVFGSDAHGGLIRFAGGTYEATFGTSGSLCVSVANDCPLTGGAFEPITVDADTVLRFRIGKGSKKDDLVIVIVGNRFLPMRARLSLKKNHVSEYTDWMYWSIIGRANQASVPRNWKEALSAGLVGLSEQGSVLFFAPADERTFPDIWAFEERLDAWISDAVLPRLDGARKMYLTNGVYAVLSGYPAGDARAFLNDAYREASFRDGRLDFRAAILPVPLYFQETLNPFVVMCADAKRLLATCDGDSIACSLVRPEENGGVEE